MKPYRFINSLELNQFKNRFLAALDYWNEQYSIHPLTIELCIPNKEYRMSNTLFVVDNSQQLLASIPNDFHKVINHALFGEKDECFNSCSENLFMVLLSKLFSIDSCSLNTRNQAVNWLYPGSTCLVLKIECDSLSIPIVLNPDWVYQNLHVGKKEGQDLISLEEALAKKTLTLNVELNSMNIPLKQLMELQVGDVIATDHKHEHPMQLHYRKKPFATAELGKTLENKSIIIKEFL